MPTGPNDQNEFFDLRIENKSIYNGLEEFKREISRAYFGDVDVYKLHTNRNTDAIVLDITTDLNLIEILVYHQKGIWGFMDPCTGEHHETISLDSALTALREKNPDSIVLEELNIYLGDCAIVIKRIYPYSIEEQLKNIFSALAKHYVHLTRELTETPYEIFVPVYSEDLLEKTDINLLGDQLNYETDYYKYWGLYFEDKNDAVIYDLSNKSFISGDLYMFGH